MPTSYSNPNFSGANIAVNSPQINLPYIWDESLGSVGQWRPTKTGDFANITIDNAELTVKLDKDNDSVNVWTDDGQTLAVAQVGNVTVDAEDLDIRDLNSVSDSVGADLLLNGATPADDNAIPVVDTLGAVVALTMTSEPEGFTGGSNDMGDSYRIRSKHGYAISVEHTSDVYAGLFIVEGSMDDSNWIRLEETAYTGVADTGIAYYDTWNFRYARTIVAPRPGDTAITGKFTVRERHDG